jgi:hypothetical protein
MKAQRKITRAEKWLFAVTGGALLFLVVFGVWRSYVLTVPDLGIPNPKMPEPNAFDLYQEAGQAIIPANPPVDAAHDFKSGYPGTSKTYPLPAKQAWLRRNAKVIALSKQAFTLPCYLPPIRTLVNDTQQFPWENLPHSRGGTFRELARFWEVVVHTRRDEKNWEQAAQSALNIYRIGCDAERGGILVDGIAGAAICNMACEELIELLPHLDLQTTKRSLHELSNLIHQQVPFPETLRQEKYSYQAGLIEVFQNGMWMHWYDGISSDATENWGRKLFLSSIPRRAVLYSYGDYMDTLIAQSRLPHKDYIPPKPDKIMMWLRIAELGRSPWNNVRRQTYRDMTLISLALRAYKLEHKTYPQNLRDLVPNYLQKIPADPFGGGEALRYRRSGREYSLYSIGPDGMDNRGRAIEDTKISREKCKRFLVLPESKGDIVAGVN